MTYNGLIIKFPASTDWSLAPSAIWTGNFAIGSYNTETGVFTRSTSCPSAVKLLCGTDGTIFLLDATQGIVGYMRSGGTYNYGDALVNMDTSTSAPEGWSTWIASACTSYLAKPEISLTAGTSNIAITINPSYLCGTQTSYSTANYCTQFKVYKDGVQTDYATWNGFNSQYIDSQLTPHKLKLVAVPTTTAIAAGIVASAYSNELQVGTSTQLSAPVITTSQSGETMTISWNAVTCADYYKLYKNGTEQSTQITTTSVTVTEEGTYAVKAYANATYTASELSNTVTYYENQLNPPTNVTCTGDTVSWTKAANATNYVIEGVSTSYHVDVGNVDSYELWDASAGTYKIWATATGYNASNAVTFSMGAQCATPVLSVSANKITWPAVEHAAGYQVWTGSTSVYIAATSAASYSYTASAGYKEYYVVAQGEDGYANSERQETPVGAPQRLGTPVIAINSSTRIITITSPSTQVTGLTYILYNKSTGSQVQTTTTVAFAEAVDPGTYYVKAQATNYSDSLASNEVTAEGTRIATPQHPTLTGNVFSWDAVTSPSPDKYNVYRTGTSGVYRSVTTPSVTLTDDGTYTVTAYKSGYIESYNSSSVTYTTGSTGSEKLFKFYAYALANKPETESLRPKYLRTFDENGTMSDLAFMVSAGTVDGTTAILHFTIPRSAVSGNSIRTIKLYVSSTDTEAVAEKVLETAIDLTQLSSKTNILINWNLSVTN